MKAVTIAVFLALTLAIASGTALAKSFYASTWQSLYPTSSTLDNVIDGTGSSCSLCHATSFDSWNGYGWDIKAKRDLGLFVDEAILAIEGFDSDLDPTVSTNLEEIGVDTQPGWTDGPNNTVFFDDGSFLTNQMPIAGILGDLDPPADEDGDGVPDGSDNCTSVANAGQQDADSDGFGNACDCDYEQNGTCGFSDFTVFLGCFGQGVPGSGPPDDPACMESDQDVNGTVGFSDFTLFLDGFGGPPGPSCCAP